VLKVFSIALLLLNQIALARILGPDGMGQVLLALNIVYMSSQFAKFGMEDAMMRFIPVHLEQKNYAQLKGTIYFALKSSFFLSLTFILLIILLSDFIAIKIFHSEELVKLIPIAAFAILFHTIRGVIGGILKGYKDTFRAVLPEYFISPFLRLCLFLVLSLGGDSPLFAIYAFVTGELIAVILSGVFLVQRFKKIQSSERSCEHRKVLDVALTMLLTGGLSIILFTQADLWIVGMYKSTETVGIYGVVTKLVMLIILPLMTFSTIIPPLIASMYAAHDIDKLRKLIRESTRWIMSISIPIILVLIVEGDVILDLVFGEQFRRGYTALIILAGGQMINAASGLVGYLLQMTGGHRLIMVINLSWGFLNIIINLFLVPRYGIVGAATSTAFCLAMGNISAIFVVYHRLSVLTLAKGLWFDISIMAVAGIAHFICSYNNILYSNHIIVSLALVVYLWKSVAYHDLPWRLILDSFKKIN
jgi:O-antigen/teichoic acid export membrane protein